jgi:hypothetical protein
MPSNTMIDKMSGLWLTQSTYYSLVEKDVSQRPDILSIIVLEGISFNY